MRGVLQLDLRSLALFRISLACLLIWDLLDRARDLTEFYTDLGVLPRYLITSQYWNEAWWSLHLSGALPLEVGGLFLAHLAVAVALALGWNTRACSLLAYLLTLSLHNRNPFVLDSADRLLLILLFWGNFLPWARYWSLDSRSSGQKSDAVVTTCLGGTGYLLQVCQVYLMAAVWKVHPVWLTERSALFRTFELQQFTKPLGYWLMSYPSLLQVLTVSTFVLEWLGPLLLLFGANTRVRLGAVVFLALLHIGIGLTMDLELFPLVSLVALVGCLPSWTWSRLPSSQEAKEADIRIDWTSAKITNALATLAILATLAWNLLLLFNSGQPPLETGGQRFPVRVMAALRLAQFWDLFSPVPRVVDSRYFVEARLSDGSSIDLLREGETFTFDRPERAYLDFKNQHERNYLNSLEWSAGRAIALRYLRRQALRWELEHPQQRVDVVRLWSRRTESSFYPDRQPVHEVEVAWAISPKSDWRGPFPVFDPHTRAVATKTGPLDF